MKLVVFAHTPPPFHGQSYMVRVLLEVCGGDARQRAAGGITSEHGAKIECFHVDARISDSLQDVGAVGLTKVFRLLRYCGEAIWCRFRFGARTFYYIPAPPKRAAVYRDWIVLALCRPFFGAVVFHWHASGLGRWLETDAKPWERWMTRRLAGKVQLSIALAEALREDAERLQPARVAILPNGIPDPCPDFDARVLPLRSARCKERCQRLADGESDAREPVIFRVCFLANCTREKGLFDAAEAVELANQRLRAERAPVRMQLTVAGTFLSEGERVEFETFVRSHQIPLVYTGFLTAADKTQLLLESDCFCFPTFYSAEAQPLSLIEAMAFGLSIVASDWRGIREMLPHGVGTVEIRSPRAVSDMLVACLTDDHAGMMRGHFVRNFSADAFRRAMALTLASLGE